MSSSPATGAVSSPDLFKNWQACLKNAAVAACYECPLYSDAWIIGDACLGPYRFINTLSRAGDLGPGGVAPRLVLRVDLRIELDPEFDTTKAHVGALPLSEEVAALASLAMGARLKAGPKSRLFLPDDERGTPFAFHGHSTPTLFRSEYGPVLPRAAQKHSVDELNWLKHSSSAGLKEQILIRP
jgi:hypothetical protein